VSYAVRFEEVTKRYPRGGPRYASLRHDLAGGLRRLGGRLRGRGADRRGAVALESVSFEVPEGESLALVGPNGAGKTTALKMVSRISYPTSGRVRVRGRVGALIEVGSGIHPELTARENIRLYGQILGMSKAEIRRHFDEIVQFAELAPVLDTPVKMYSSGMQLRLGFSIAAHLDPEVFVVDEALAVGDAGFQVKCVERMMKLVQEGRTLIFVSHTLPLVRVVCTRGLLLEAGRVAFSGTADEVVTHYLDRVGHAIGQRPPSNEPVRVVGIRVLSEGVTGAPLTTDAPVTIELDLVVKAPLPDAVLGVGIADGRPGNLITMSMLSQGRSVSLSRGVHTVRCVVRSLPLLPSAYEVWFSALSRERATYYAEPSVVGTLLVSEGPKYRRNDLLFARTGGFGPVCVPYEIEVEQQEAASAPRATGATVSDGS
jgi:ABC-type polysaccharide/polyol phosphate transport system ATPase subunit